MYEVIDNAARSESVQQDHTYIQSGDISIYQKGGNTKGIQDSIFMTPAVFFLLIVFKVKMKQ